VVLKWNIRRDFTRILGFASRSLISRRM
jgi:hypothetical protein